MKNELLKLLQKDMEKEGTTLEQAIRDALTHLRHIARDNDINFHYANKGSKEVFKEEIYYQKEYGQ